MITCQGLHGVLSQHGVQSGSGSNLLGVCGLHDGVPYYNMI